MVTPHFLKKPFEEGIDDAEDRGLDPDTLEQSVQITEILGRGAKFYEVAAPLDDEDDAQSDFSDFAVQATREEEIEAQTESAETLARAEKMTSNPAQLLKHKNNPRIPLTRMELDFQARV
ncbi:MAG: hypothetical protein Q9170_004572 [Blastenia crenularia]